MNLSRSAILVAFLALSPAAPVYGNSNADADSAASPVSAAELQATVRAFFEERFARDHVPGGAFALVFGDRLVMLEGFGLADVEAGTPVDPERTVFRVGSNSKTVTALAALQAVEAGRLGLHDDISEALGWTIPSTFPEPITLHHLLTHTSGLVEELLSQHRRNPHDLPTLERYLREGLPRRAQPPGVVVSYNDHGTSLAGLLVEKANGVPFAESVKRSVFDPLGMARSSFEQVELPDAMERDLAVAYRWDDENGRVEPLARDYVVTVPAAGLYTTAADMSRFLRALLGHGELDGTRILPAERTDAMLATQFRHGEGMNGRAYGLVERELAGRRLLAKDGQCSGFTARLAILPEQDLAWFSVVNLSIFGPAGAIQPVARFHRDLAGVLGELLPPLDSAPAAPRSEAIEPIAAPTPLSRLVGTYRETSDPRDTWESLLIDNELEVGADGDELVVFSSSGWTEVDPLTFRNADGNVVRFLEDDAGSVRWVTYGPGAWERIPWWRTQRTTLRAGAILLAILLTAIAGSAVVATRHRGEPGTPGTWAGLGAALLVLAFGASWAGSLFATDVQILFSGPTPLQRALLALPPLAIVLAGFALVRLAFRRRRTGLWRRAWPALAATTTLALCALLGLWNLIGWQI